VTVSVSPSTSLEDQAIRITATGLGARQKVILRMRSRDAKRVDWTSSAAFRADSHGTLDLRRAAASSGSYTGVWPTGLIASMKPATAGPGRLYFWNGPQPLRFTVSLSAGGRTIAASTFRRRLSASRVVSSDQTLRGAGFVGTFFAPAGTGRKTAVLSFGGSEGGLSTYLLGALLAARGHPTLALAYFDEPGLPQTLQSIPLEYFAKALAWLRTQPGVDPSHVVALGISRGSEAALLLGVHYPKLVHAVVASVPSNVSLCGITTAARCAGPAWTLGGKPLPYTRQFDNPAPTDDPAAVIPVEMIAGPVFLDCAGKDEVWSSCAYAHAIIARLEAHHTGYRHVLYTSPRAGHLSGGLIPDEPGSGASEPTFVADAQARERVWPRLLRFLKVSGHP
jgi:dienelactone hydrolase